MHRGIKVKGTVGFRFIVDLSLDQPSILSLPCPVTL